MADTLHTVFASSLVVNNLPKHQTTKNVVHKEFPPPYGLPLKNTNTSGNVHSEPQSESRHNADFTRSFGDARLTQIPSTDHIKSYKIWSILNMIFCYICLGCIACGFSMNTEKLIKRGDTQGALNASKLALRIHIITTVVGTILIAIFILYQNGVFE